MVQADHRMTVARAAQVLVELGQHLHRDPAAGLHGYDAVEQHEAPGADIHRTVEFERAARQRLAHLRYEVVVARNTHHGLAVAREQPAERRVSGRIVLHEIAGDEDRVGNGQVPGRVLERALESFEGIDAAQCGGRVTEQVRIGELDDSDGAHSIELYKHAAAQRVMRVTPRNPVFRGGEPGRKLPQTKRESASSHGDSGWSLTNTRE